ncbi:MAG TPA: Ig-like domain repeat protein [Candidatus Acidoferrum sp.]|nr:Ig-like domain repeat protein [Candidatus Acidoferrum sp.]
MRMIRLLGSVSALLACLSGSVSFGQAVPPNAVPLITEVTPPSLPPTATAPGNGNFTLTILGANFPSTVVVNLTGPGNFTLHPSSTSVSATGSQITAHFTNAVVASPATLFVTVTNPGGSPPSTSNAFYLPETPAEPSVVLNQNLTTILTGNPKGILTADLNGNGSLDVAVVSQGSNTVSILQSNFTGTFTSGGSYSTGSQPWGIVAADFFGTGQLGLAITNSGDNTITILLPNGSGTFRAGNTISLPGVYPTQLVAGDFNEDGKIDLAVVNTCGTGAGGCFPQAAPQGPGTVTILLGNGDGTFSVSPATLTTGNVPYSIVAADLNSDGFIDLVVANQNDNNLTILMGNGDGTFTPTSLSPTTGNEPSAIAVGDFNGDGNLDIAVTNSTDNSVSILLNQNCSSLPLALCAFAAAPISPAVGASPAAISTADMNADGFLDLVVANSTGNSVSVLLGNGTGAFNAVVPQGQPDFSTGAAPQGLVLGDFNQDGRLDIVTSNTSGSFTFLRQAGTPQLVLTTSNPSSFYGLFLTFTVNVSPSFGQPAAPTGTITFFDGATSIGTVSLSGYQAYFYYPYLNAGSHQVTAAYSGDANFVPATSNAVSETVTQAQTTATLTSNVNAVSYVQPFTLTATIQPQNTGTATGTVTFFDTTSSTTLGSATLANNLAQLTLSKLTPGAHVMVASYQGDSNFTGSSSPTYTENILQASTTIAVVSSPTTISLGQSTTLTATIQPGAGNTATGAVVFLDNMSPLGFANVSNNSATFTASTLTVGTHAITAQYTGDNNFSGSTSAAIPETVTQGSASISLTTNNNPSIYGQAVTLIANVQPISTTTAPTGSVTFMNGGATLAIVPLSNGSAQLRVSTMAVGSNLLTAKYSGDSNFQANYSSFFVQNVAQAGSSTTLTSSQNPAPFGQAVTLTAAVQLPFGGAATGNVTFYDGATSLGNVTPTNNSAQLTVSNFTAGSHSITARYLGDSNTGASMSAAVSQSVTAAPTTTTITSSLNPSSYGQAVTFVAAWTPAAAGTNGGVISIYADGAPVYSVAIAAGAPRVTLSNLTVGTHSLTAQFTPWSSNYAASTSAPLTQTVNQAASLITVFANPNPSTYGQNVNLQASISTTGHFTTANNGTLTFLDNGASIGSVTLPGNTNYAVLASTALSPGAHSITVSYSGDANFLAGTSAVVTQTVNLEPTTTLIAATTYTPAFAQSITLTATVKPLSGTTATGTVTFLDRTTTIGTAPLSSNSAQMTISTLAAGTHYISAQYSGDANTATSTSGQTLVTVSPPPTTTLLTSSTNPSSLNQPVTLTATLQLTSSGTPTGTVTFYDGSSSIGTGTIASGSAQLTISGLQIGTHSIAATYSGDANFSGSTSAALSQVVNQGPTATAVTSSSNPAIVGFNITFTVNVSPSYGGTPTGLVTLYDGATSLGSVSLTNQNGQNYALFTLSTLTTGSHAMTARYNGNAFFAASTSAVLTETVNLPATSTYLSSNVNPAAYGQTLSLVANVQPPGSGSATGTVTFLDGSTTLGTVNVSNNTAQLSGVTLSLGSHTLTAQYSGDTKFAGSTSAPVTETVNQSATTTTVSPNISPSNFGQTVVLTAVIVPSAGGTVTGTVTFVDGATSLGTATVSSNIAQLSLSSLSLGSHSITAKYSGDGNFTASTSAAVTQTVNQAYTMIAVASNLNPAIFGQSVVLTATVQPSNGGTVTGTVTFLDSTTPLGTATVSSDAAQLSLASLSAGPHSITAKYSGDTNFTGSTSSSITQTISQAGSTTTVASNLNPTAFGQAITFTISVQPSAGGTPTGTVTLMDGTTSLGNSSLSSGGSAQFTMGGLSAGSHSVTAVYGGDANFTASTSAALVETVNQGATTTTLTSSANPSAFDQSVTLTATVQPPAGTTATGAVTFMDGSTSLGSVTLSSNSAQLTVSTLTVGTHSVTAVYAGSANLTGSTSAVLGQVVNGASTTTLVSSSANPSTFGQAVTLSAAIQPAFGGSATGTITFLDGATSLGTATVSSNAGQLSLSSLTAGSHSITAKYSGDANFSGSTSSALTQTVNQGSTATTIASSLNPSVFGQSVVFTATVQPPAGTTASGTVTFLDGATSLGTAPVSNNSAQLAVSGLLLGSHSVTASYGGNTNLSGSVSAILPQTVNQAATSTSISSNANPATFGQAVTFTATVQPVASGVPPGTVTFFDGGAQIGSATLSGGVAQFTAAAGALAAGTHSITARYNGDANFLSSTSGTLAEAVNAAQTSTLLTTSASPSITGHSVTFTATVSSSVSGTQTGTVSFYFDGSTTSAGSAALSAGVAQFSTSSLSVGNHTVVATFASTNSNFQGSSSATLTQQISDFSISAAPSSLTVSKSHSGTYTLTLSPLSGFTGAVSLSCSGVPSHTTCSISPNQITLDGTSSAQATVTITVGGGANTGKHTLTCKGISGTIMHSTTVTLTIN